MSGKTDSLAAVFGLEFGLTWSSDHFSLVFVTTTIDLTENPAGVEQGLMMLVSPQV